MEGIGIGRPELVGRMPPWRKPRLTSVGNPTGNPFEVSGGALIGPLGTGAGAGPGFPRYDIALDAMCAGWEPPSTPGAGVGPGCPK